MSLSAVIVAANCFVALVGYLVIKRIDLDKSLL